MKIGTRLYIFIGGITLIAFAIFGFYIYNVISNQITDDYAEAINEYMANYEKMIELEIESKQRTVEVSINLALTYFNSLGNLTIVPNEFVSINNNSINKWLINGVQIQNSTHIVDRYTEMGIELSSVFQKTTNGYVRIATSVMTEAGERAVGSVIPFDSPVAQAIGKGERYIGRNFVIDTWLIAAYEPIMYNGEIVGIVAVAEPEINYSGLSADFTTKAYFGSGYPYIVDANGILTSHPNAVGLDLSEYEFFDEMVANKNGVVVYDWKGRMKTQYYKHIPAINSYITVGWYNDDYDKVFASLRMVMIIATLLALFAVLGTLFVIVRNVTRPIAKAVTAAENLAEGNMDVDLETNNKDETGVLLGSMKKMADTIKKLVRELDSATDAAINGKLDKRADESAFQGEYKNIMKGVNGTLDAVIGPLNVTAEYVDRISKGDIPPRITDEYKGDFNEIKNNLNQCIDSVNLLVTDAKMLSHAAIEGKLDTRANASKHNGEFRAIVQGVNDTLDNVIGPLNVAAEYVDRISKGDIPPRITDEYKGDFNEIKNNLNQCIDSLNGLIAEMNNMSKQHDLGDIDVVINTAKFTGAYRDMAQGVNDMVNGHINVKKKAMACFMEFGRGNFEAKIEQFPGKKVFINETIEAVRSNIKNFIIDMNEMSKQHDLGDIDIIMPAEKYAGSFHLMAQGVNDMVNGHISVKKKAMGCFMEFGNGNLDAKIEQFPGKKAFINDTIEKVRQNIKALVTDATMLAKAAVEGKLDTRADASKHQGDFRAIVQGVNNTLDNVIGPLNVAAEYVDRISKGDIPPRITDNYNGDFNEIKNNLNQCIDAVDHLVADAKMLAQAALDGRLSTRADASKHHGDFRAIVDGVNQTLDSVIEPINEAGEVLSIMAGGDLTVRVVGNYKGELSKLKNDINSLAEALSYLLTQVNEVVHSAASSALEISSTAESLAASTQEQSAQSDEVASAVEEMSRTVTENAMSASKTAEVAQNNGYIATEGGKVVQQTVVKMREIASVVKNSAGNIEKLGESSKQIGEIISVIDDIADQTNLLALNAAIEAARAGEQGRGFAVVADEVRKLAERTTEATKQIANMIKGIQKETEHAVIAMNQGTTEVQSGISLADNAGESLKQILSSTQEVMDMISQIASASEEQSATSEQISKNVLSISKVSAESAHRVEDVAHTADELAKLTEHLSELMTQFKVDGSSKQAGHGKSIDSGKKGKHLAANN